MLACAAAEFRDLGVRGEILATGAVVGCYAPGLAAAGYPIHHLPFKKSLLFFWRVLRLLGRGYDVVHIHVEQALFWYALAARAARVPVVIRTAHSTFEFTGWLRVRRALQRRVLAALRVGHVAISHAVRDNERVRFGIEAQVVFNWCDGRTFRIPSDEERRKSRQQLGVGYADFVIVSVGNCSGLKNHSELLHAIAELRVGRRVVYLHVGDERLAPGERELAAELGLTEAARFLGPVEDVSSVLFAADVYVMPSRTEGFGVAALEAIATGLPAILASVGGLKELATHFRGVRLVAPEADGLASALAAAAESNRDRRDDEAFNAAVVQERFSASAGARAYTRLYRGCTPGDATREPEGVREARTG